MKKIIIAMLSLSLVACAIEEEQVEKEAPDQSSVQGQEEVLTGTFMLRAESGYISRDNNRDAEIYIINTDSNEVYIAGKGKKLQEKTVNDLNP